MIRHSSLRGAQTDDKGGGSRNTTCFLLRAALISAGAILREPTLYLLPFSYMNFKNLAFILKSKSLEFSSIYFPEQKKKNRKLENMA